MATGNLQRLGNQGRRMHVLTQATTVTPDGPSGPCWQLILTTNTNVTIANPTNASEGALHTLEIRNSTGGVYSATFAFGTNFQFAGGAAPAVPANSKSTFITFEVRFRSSAYKFLESSRAAEVV